MHRNVFHSLCVLIGVATSLLVASTNAATHNVSVSGVDFTPDVLTIDVGDTVVWTWGSGTHNVESGVSGAHDGNFRSGDPTFGAGTMYQVVFDQAFLDANPMPNNEYPYYCALHFNFGMTGMITVDPGTPVCPADFTDSTGTMPDGQVNVFDLFVLLSNWNTSGTGADLAAPNDVVDVFDLFVLLGAWGDC